jgi:hypothetical protein
MAAGTNPLAKVGLALAVLLTLGVITMVGLGVANRWRSAPAAQPPPGPVNEAGWEIKYNAAQALARRGSLKTPLDVLEQMLDEERQRRSARITIDQGKQGKKEVPYEPMAQETVLAGLRALVVLHQKQPELDLSRFDAPLARLEQSGNLVLRTEALKTRQALKPSTQSGE